LAVEGAVADGCEVIEVGKTFPGAVQLNLGPAQLLVLQFQFDLVDP